MMDKEQGRAIDEFYGESGETAQVEVTRPVIPECLKGFDYLECTDCHSFHDIAKVQDIHLWKFSLMGLRPSILHVAKGLCTVCQDMRKDFKGILSQ